MTIDELISRLQAMNTGAPEHVLVRDEVGNYWEPTFEHSRVRRAGDAPYAWDNDCPHSLVVFADRPSSSSGLTFDEVVDALRSFTGKAVEVAIRVPRGDRDGLEVASFSGVVDRVDEAREFSGQWRMWLDPDSAGPVLAAVAETEYLGADFRADRDEASGERVDEAGLTWTLTIRQTGVETEVMVYV